METTRLFRFIDEASEESRHLAVALAGSDNTLDQRLVARLTINEQVWMTLFQIANVKYYSNGFTSAAQASAQLAILRSNIVLFKQVYLGEINKAIRVLLSDTDTTSQVVRKPTLNIPMLINAGKLSASASVVNAAATLEAAYDKWVEAVPNLRTSPADGSELKACDSWSGYLRRMRDDVILLSPSSKVLGAYRQVKEYVAVPAILWGNLGTLLRSQVTTAGVYTAAAADLAASHWQVGDTTDSATKIYYWTGTGLNVVPDVIQFIANPGVKYMLVINFASAGSAILADIAGVFTPNVATPPLLGVSIQTVAGLTYPGTAIKTTTATTTQMVFVWEASEDAYLNIPSVTQNFYRMELSEVKGFGSMSLSADGDAEPTTLNDPTVLDCIGGRNVKSTVQALNFSNFGNILAVVQVLSEVHGDNHVYNALNLHYQTHVQTALDTSSDLNSLIPDPLKTVDFWLGSNAATGITKPSRQKLFKVYWGIVSDLVDMAGTDGYAATYFAGL
jgi:hypothetical protein